MKKTITVFALIIMASSPMVSQIIPLDTSHWDINANAYVLEKYHGEDAIYLQSGAITLKNKVFLNGTIEYDIFLKEEQAFPGVFFRIQESSNTGEEFYIRPHLSGKPDANQVAPLTKGITAWQMYFGPTYSFPYQYKYNGWTHVKILVNGGRAQIFLDYSEKPQLSWNLFHPAKEGKVFFTGGNRSGMHLANIHISHDTPKLKDFAPVVKKPVKGIISSWKISDKFSEENLNQTTDFNSLLATRKWDNLPIEEGTAANISRLRELRNNVPGNTVFAKVELYSDTDQIKLFHFGYSDRIVVIFNGEKLYKGNNMWRSRDYRYLGTIGLFDGVYLPLKQGNNTLLLAVSENFGGWLVTGKFEDMEGIKILE